MFFVYYLKACEVYLEKFGSLAPGLGQSMGYVKNRLIFEKNNDDSRSDRSCVADWPCDNEGVWENRKHLKVVSLNKRDWIEIESQDRATCILTKKHLKI
jgi:hypothetical protein